MAIGYLTPLTLRDVYYAYLLYYYYFPNKISGAFSMAAHAPRC